MLKKKNDIASVCGVGINDSEYDVTIFENVYVDGKKKQKLIWRCPYYRVWCHMITRCYSDRSLENKPSYVGCSVSQEWLRFSNFRSWMELQDWSGKQLDKDLLFSGNRVYSEETCVFVSRSVNLFTVESIARRGEWPLGVSRKTTSDKFVAHCNNPFTKKGEHLGYYVCPAEAHRAWLARKLELAHLLAAEQTDKRIANAIIARYESYNHS